MGGRRARWLVAGVASALVGAVLPTGVPAASASVTAGQAPPARTGTDPGGKRPRAAAGGQAPRAGIDRALAAAP